MPPYISVTSNAWSQVSSGRAGGSISGSGSGSEGCVMVVLGMLRSDIGDVHENVAEK